MLKTQRAMPKGEEAQAVANRNNVRSLYRITHEIANARRVSGAPMKSKYGKL